MPTIVTQELAVRAVIESVAADNSMMRKKASTGGKDYEAVTLAANMQWTGATLNTIQDIQTGSTPTFAGLLSSASIRLTTDATALLGPTGDDSHIIEIAAGGTVAAAYSHGAAIYLAGNDHAQAGDLSIYAGSDSGSEIRVYIGATQVGVVDHDGNVGWGETSPDSEHHVHRASGNTCYDRVSVQGYDMAMGVDIWDVAEVRYSNYIGGGSTRSTFWIHDAGSDARKRFAIHADGKLSAGIETPAWDLHLGPYLLGWDGGGHTNTASLQNKSTVIGVASSNGAVVYTAKFDMTNAGLLQIGNTAGNTHTVLYANNSYTYALAIAGDRTAASFFSGVADTKWDWHTDYGALEVGNHGAIMASLTAPLVGFGAGLFYDGAWKHSVNGIGAYMQISSGVFTWDSSTSGTTPNAASLTTKMTLNAVGNLGIEVTPEAWHSDYTALQVGANCGIMAKTAEGATNGLWIMQNAYYDGAWKRMTNDEATVYIQQSGAHLWYTAAAAAADAGFSFTNIMYLTADGKLSINTGAAPGVRLDVLDPGNAGAGAMAIVADFLTTAASGHGSCIRVGDGATIARFIADNANTRLLIATGDPWSTSKWIEVNATYFVVDGLYAKLATIKSGATQAGAGAAADEIWKTSSHATLPDNVLLIGV